MNHLINVTNTMTSLEIAKITGKEHKNIIRDIKDETEKLQGVSTQLIFELSEYKDITGRKLPMYICTTDGVMQLGARYDATIRYKLIQKVKELTTPKAVSPAQFLLQQAQLMVEIDERVNAVEKSITKVEHNIRRTVTSNHLTVIAYANIKRIKPYEYNSSAIGKKATKICKEEGLQIGKVVDSKYGLINTYPEDVLDRIFFS